MTTYPQHTTALVASIGFVVALALPREIPLADAHRGSPPRASANDNRRAAGVLRDGKLELKLEIVNGQWYPESDAGLSVPMQAFAEEGRAPEIPGPLIRVPEGTQIHITLHNALPDSEVVVHGLHTRPATTDDVVKIPAGASREVTFLAGAAGTYFYWATTTKQPLQYRVGKDSQLSGAIVVDPIGAARSDRTFVIGLYSDDPDSMARRAPHPREIVVINGKSWPYTEQFTFNEGDTAAWRVINATATPHPMHLHGFYFDIERSGAEAADTALNASEISRANTKLLLSGTSMMVRFVTNRPGNWLFHCHLALHVDGDGTLKNIINRSSLDEIEHEHSAIDHHTHAMAGLIVGIHVLPRGASNQTASTKEPQNLRLLIQTSPLGYSSKPAIGFVLQNGKAPQADSVTLPGPTLFLETGRRARITVVNHLKVPTSVHWHGMEIDSYPDGVAGWSGMPGRLAPQIQPADSFVAEFTPPRAGTFIYHSHMNELIQTNSGMYGVLMVTDSLRPFDARVDKIILVGGGGPGTIEKRSTGMVNGSAFPELQLIAGSTYRLHIVQIHPQAMVSFRLGTDTTVAQWTPVAKDGADLPAQQSSERAAYTLMGPGETGEFLFTPRRPGLMKMNIQTRGPGWHVPLLIFVRPPAKVATN